MQKSTRKDLIAWCDEKIAQLDARMRAMQDGEENNIQRSEDAQGMRMLVRIKEALGEMTAVEYVEARKSLCYKSEHCKHCTFTALHRGYADLYWSPCVAVESREPDRAVEIVKRWKEERRCTSG